MIPYSTGHPPWSAVFVLYPDFFKLYQKRIEPLVGDATIPWFGKTVSPPSSTSDNWIFFQTDASTLHVLCQGVKGWWGDVLRAGARGVIAPVDY